MKNFSYKEKYFKGKKLKIFKILLYVEIGKNSHLLVSLFIS